MKKLTTITTLIAAAMFAGSVSAAGDKQSEDIVYGNGAAPNSAAESYVQIEAKPQETGDFLLWNLHQTESINGSSSFVQGVNDQDNRDDLRDRV